MKRCRLVLPLLATVIFAAPAAARTVTIDAATPGGGGGELPPYLQCVPYARQVSGIAIYGDAHTWWQQAAGRYARGSSPRVGAVMAFRPHGNMKLGHVAAISRVIDSRTVLLRHANWSEIEGRRGQIEDNVRAIDVSPNNDWSAVRVWYAPTGALGVTHWPVEGFIYKLPIASGKAAPPARTASAAPPRKAAASGAIKLARIDDPIGEIIARARR